MSGRARHRAERGAGSQRDVWRWSARRCSIKGRGDLPMRTAASDPLFWFVSWVFVRGTRTAVCAWQSRIVALHRRKGCVVHSF